jgi:hypothetical protein
VPRGSYRDELQAAHERIAALEQELAEARGEGSGITTLPAVIDEQLVDSESILWHGRPSPARYAFGGSRWLFGALWGGLAIAWLPMLLRGLRISGFVGAALLAGGALLAWSGMRALSWARGTGYAITSGRILVAGMGQTMVSIPLTEVTGSALRLRTGSCGDIILATSGSGEVTLECLPEAAKVFRLVEESRKALEAAAERPRLEESNEESVAKRQPSAVPENAEPSERRGA